MYKEQNAMENINKLRFKVLYTQKIFYKKVYRAIILRD